MPKPPIIIIGTGLAGYSLARSMRLLDKTVPLCLITRDNGAYYSKPQLSRALADNKTAETLVMSHVTAMAQQLQADILTHTEVLSVDPKAQEVHLADKCLPYSQLVFASGANVVAPPIKGSGKDSVLSVNSLQDYAAYRSALEGKKHILIMGAGLIGCEFANDLRVAGFHVTVVAPEARPLSALLPDALGTAFQAALAKHGVIWQLGRSVVAVDAFPEGFAVTLDNDEQLEADLVISAIGIRADLRVAKAAGLEVNRGIVVNDICQSSEPNIYAMGDCAEVQGQVLQYVKPLRQCATALAQTLTGKPSTVHYPVMPIGVKTSLCPVTAVPPAKDALGNWDIVVDEDNGKALFYDNNMNLLGFSLIGECTSLRAELAKQMA